MHLITIKMSFASVHFATFLIYLKVFYLSTNLFFHPVFLVGMLILFTFEMRITKEHIQVKPGKPGGRSFKKEKETIQRRKNLPIECAQSDQPVRCPNHFFAVNQPSAVPWW